MGFIYSLLFPLFLRKWSHGLTGTLGTEVRFGFYPVIRFRSSLPRPKRYLHSSHPHFFGGVLSQKRFRSSEQGRCTAAVEDQRRKWLPNCLRPLLVTPFPSDGPLPEALSKKATLWQVSPLLRILAFNSSSLNFREIGF